MFLPSVTPLPKIGGAINDTIRAIFGSCIIEKESDAVVYATHNSWYITGELTINSGTLSFTQVRLTSKESILRVKNNAKVTQRKDWFIMGNSNSATDGGLVYLSENAKLELSSKAK